MPFGPCPVCRGTGLDQARARHHVHSRRSFIPVYAVTSVLGCGTCNGHGTVFVGSLCGHGLSFVDCELCREYDQQELD
jgi:hypothetical protein